MKAIENLKKIINNKFRAKKESSTIVVNNKKVLIDASVTNVPEILKVLEEQFKNNKIILTSITIMDLDALKKRNKTSGYNTRRILKMAATHPELYESVVIEEDPNDHDGSIIKYCETVKENVILITADAAMVARATGYGIETFFLKQDYNSKIRRTSDMHIMTLHSLKKVGDKMFLTNLNKNNRSYMVISEGCEFNMAVMEVKIGDDIYICRYDHKDNCIVFSHHKVISDETKRNVDCMFTKRIYNCYNKIKVPEEYISFIENFRREKRINK